MIGIGQRGDVQAQRGMRAGAGRGEHWMQLFAAALASRRTWPKAQSTHATVPSEYCPESHSVQAVAPTEGACRPAVQALHVDCSVCGCIWPTLQIEHSDAPTAAAKPTLQEVQAELPSLPALRPALQFRQSLA